jgi:alpha-glucosidase
VTYNGDEIGMLDYREISWEDTLDPAACSLNDAENYKEASRDPQRTPFQWDGTVNAGFKDAVGDEPWIQVHPNYPQLNLKLQQEATKSVYKFYQQLALLRQNDTFVFGDFKSTAINKDVFGYVRSLDGDITYVILINFSDKEMTIDVNSLGVKFNDKAQVVLAGSASEYNAG